MEYKKEGDEKKENKKYGGRWGEGGDGREVEKRLEGEKEDKEEVEEKKEKGKEEEEK